MHGKAAEFLLEIHRDHLLALVLGRGLVERKAVFGQLRRRAGDGVGLDGDVAVLAEVGVLHDLHAASGEVGAVALLHAEAEGRVERAAHRKGLLRVAGVHADVRDLKAERGLARLLAEARDLVEVVRGDVRLGAQPAAADGMDERRGDVLGKVLVVHAAGGDELDAAEGAGERLHRAQAAVDIGREELHDLQTVGHCRHDLRRRDAARGDGDIVLHAPAHDLVAVAGGDDELCAAGDGLLALLERDDRTRAHEHIGALLRDGRDGVGCRRRAERDLHHVHAACEQRLCSGYRVGRVVKHDDGHDRSVI